ncbi:GAF domain-containing protein [Couchioplanes azureus]|uniref:GAF domain-containing protein n=1 Tax=Couchioplanes caeruleus TaxID=56438 RepID=UPI00166F9C6F|nr:GAF domain-containing protein [Couchioplanes caeruleus]GGQ85126.1 hypothetical protein GCM10010166_64210 [Couchioplanes caeruleus subsp. azureus]
MSEFRPSPPALAAEIAAIATRAASLPVRAEALLQAVQPVIRFDAAHLDLLDPECRLAPSLARRGYPAGVERHLDSPARLHDLELAGILRQRRPMRLEDLPVPPGEIRLWAEHLQPAGFGNGVGLPLVTPDGRYLGLLCAHTVTTTGLSDATCDLLAGLAPLLAHVVDPMSTMTSLASAVTDAVAGVVATRAGDTAPLPGLPGHPLLAPGAPVLREAVDCLDAGDTHVTFLTPIHPRGYLRTTVLGSQDPPVGHLRGVVLFSPPGDLHGLTHRDLTVVGMLLAGWPLQRIATRLHLPAFALLTILDHIRAELGARTRDAAVLRAATLGTYLPPRLSRRQPA